MIAVHGSSWAVYVIDLNAVGRCGAPAGCTHAFPMVAGQPVTPVGDWCLAEDEDGALWSAQVIEVRDPRVPLPSGQKWMTLRLDHRIGPTCSNITANSYLTFHGLTP